MVSWVANISWSSRRVDVRKKMALPMGAATAAIAMTKVMNHLIFRLYSCGSNISGTIVNRPRRPRLFDLGITDIARERIEAALLPDFSVTAASTRGALSMEFEEAESKLRFGLPTSPESLGVWPVSTTSALSGAASSITNTPNCAFQKGAIKPVRQTSRSSRMIHVDAFLRSNTVQLLL